MCRYLLWPGFSNDYRHIVVAKAELREMEERKKRASSVVIHGLRVCSAEEAATTFADITSSLVGEPVTLSEVCRIRTDADLFRGNIHNNRLRKLVLDNSKHLRDSEYSHVFIRQDLTFQQCEELKARYPPRTHCQKQEAHSDVEVTMQCRGNNQPPMSESYQETVPKQVTHAPSSASAQDSSTSVPMGSDLPASVSQEEEEDDHQNPGPSSSNDEGN